MSYKVKINIFEGPFDLLVYLIENARMSIYDIKVSEITAQYIKYIEEMQKMDVLLASEFMVLAATLIDIKSKMLLPKQVEEEEGGIGEDPRTELVQKLIEYKKFKNASEILARKEEETSRILDKPREDLSFFTNEPDEYLKLNINQFVKAFNDFLIKKKKVDEIRRNYERDERQRITTEVRMDFIRELILKWPEKVFTFKELVTDPQSKYDTALSFVSMLEMIKQRRIEASQKTLFGEIKINATAYLDNGKEEEPDDKQKIN
ncbi:MAG TPA: segregation/condensation protein A [Bacillota bacterium]|nr:segregation/condensation protein A [Bacillota bacterium]HUM55548.1 segregation/condensation protein A [Bacillota bacterium]